ncbi:MAG: phospholipase D-like domain-containing protein [Alphaproteobacteria bacterium]
MFKKSAQKKYKEPKKVIQFLLGVFIGMIVSYHIITPKSNVIYTKNPAVWEVCFPPKQPCLPMIINAIRKARHSIRVQGYTLTSDSIVKEFLNAHNQGIKIFVLLDKTQCSAHNDKVQTLYEKKVAIKIDYKPAIAHNKVMIIDNHTILTGSYNWTNGAEQKNAENLLRVNSVELTKEYINNFEERWASAINFQEAKNKIANRNKSKAKSSKNDIVKLLKLNRRVIKNI